MELAATLSGVIAELRRIERAAQASAELRFAVECRVHGQVPEDAVMTDHGQERLAYFRECALRMRQSRLLPLQRRLQFLMTA